MSDSEAASPPGITVIVASTVVSAMLAMQDGLVGATVGGRRALGAVPRRRTAAAAGGTLAPAAAAAADAAPGPLDDRACCTMRRRPRPRSRPGGSGPAGPCPPGGSARATRGVPAASARSRSHPLPPEGLVVDGIGERVGAFGALTTRAHGRAVDGTRRRTRVRRQRQTTNSQITSAPAEHRPALPLLAVGRSTPCRGRSRPYPFDHPNASLVAQRPARRGSRSTASRTPHPTAPCPRARYPTRAAWRGQIDTERGADRCAESTGTTPAAGGTTAAAAGSTRGSRRARPRRWSAAREVELLRDRRAQRAGRRRRRSPAGALRARQHDVAHAHRREHPPEPVGEPGAGQLDRPVDHEVGRVLGARATAR